MKCFTVLSFATFLAVCILQCTDAKNLVCYYGSWAVYRPEGGKYDVENIDPFLCTHIIYGFAGLSWDGIMTALDGYNDLPDNWGKGAFVRFTGLKEKNPSLKTLLAIGGWNEGSSKYSDMAATAAGREKFITNAITFLKQYNFDGLDLDWEYPAQRGGKPEDRENHAALLKEMKAAFAPEGLLMTAAVSAGKGTIDVAYDVPKMAESLDYINLMSYDYHGAFDKVTGLNSPMYGSPEYDQGDNVYFNTNFSVHYWISLGAPPEKINMGVPLYGRCFKLDKPEKNGIGVAGSQPCTAGPYTREAGFLGYNEICVMLKEGGWTVVRDPNYQVPYMVKGDQWIGYDDVESITIKANYVNEMNLAGAMVWSVETDDFHGNCGDPENPLLHVLNSIVVGDQPPPPTTTTDASQTTTSTTPGSTTTTTTTTTTSAPTPAPSEICKEVGLNADPTNCNRYYDCSIQGDDWVTIPYECGAGTVFDPQGKVCTWPDAVPGCSRK